MSQAVHPSPVPLQFQLRSGELERPDGTKQQVIWLSVSSPTGTFEMFLAPAEARDLAGKLVQQADQALTNSPIVVPTLNGPVSLNREMRRALGPHRKEPG